MLYRSRLCSTEYYLVNFEHADPLLAIYVSKRITSKRLMVLTIQVPGRYPRWIHRDVDGPG